MEIHKKIWLILITVTLMALFLPAGVALSAGDATVEVNNGATLELDEGEVITCDDTTGVPVAVKNLPVGLAGFQFKFTWNPAVITVDSGNRSDSASGWSITFGEPDNVSGELTVTGYTTSYSTDDILLIYLGITATGSDGDTGTLGVTVVELIDESSAPIANSAVNAPITITAAPETADVEVAVGLQGSRTVEAQCIMPVTVKFFTPGADVMADVPVYSQTVTTSKTGANLAGATVTGVEPGTYDVSIISEHTLTNVKTNVTVAAPTTAVDMGTFSEGDANGDGEVTFLDISTLVPSYSKSEGDPGFNPLVDFDRSGNVDFLDVSVFVPNYQKQSPITVP